MFLKDGGGVEMASWCFVFSLFSAAQQFRRVLMVRNLFSPNSVDLLLSSFDTSIVFGNECQIKSCLNEIAVNLEL